MFDSKIRLQKPKLATGAIPSIFMNVPQSCIPVPLAPRRRPRQREDGIPSSVKVSESCVTVARKRNPAEHEIKVDSTGEIIRVPTYIRGT